MEIQNSNNSLNTTNSGRNSSSSSNQIQTPSITLPKGGGAIKSMDEKFSVNSSNGTSGYSIPLPFSKSRNYFAPAVSLSYSSGAGNGIFGLGWNIDIPSIARKTEQELPKYRDAIESDTFIFSASDDLVSQFRKDDAGNYTIDANGKYVVDELIDGTKKIKRYRPRIEGAFARIEKIEDGDEIYWKVISRDNVTSIFGKTKGSRIADPNDPKKIFEWILDFSYDDKGNSFKIEYKEEDGKRIPNKLHEKNRINNQVIRYTNCYPKRIKYCNKKHFIADEEYEFRVETGDRKFLLEMVFDYGDHDNLIPTPTEVSDWSYRDDAFSNYRSGFEIRTTRLCKRVLMFHHFDELKTSPYSNDNPYLVRSLEFEYSNNLETKGVVTFLNSIAQKGFIWDQTNSTYKEKQFPPLEFLYQERGRNTSIKKISSEDIVNAPVGIDGSDYQWIDLFSEGISGILTEQNNAWLYKSNLGKGDFTNANLIIQKPSYAGLNNGAMQLQELEANSQKFLVSRINELNGFFEMTENNEWLPFETFDNFPNLDFSDPNVKFLDLNGDGIAEIIISENEVFTWYESKGKKGYDEAKSISKPLDEEAGPKLVFNDQTQSIVIADMSGDGLLDIARIKNGEICYWPNLGYGRFGGKVTMDNAPIFDHPENFNPMYVKLGDIDGAGPTDLIYLGKDNFKVYYNESGNSFSDAESIEFFFKIDDQANVEVIDLLGNGTGCIVWSSPLPNNSNSPLRYIDLMDGKKPHVMITHKNNLGKEVNLKYLPSTLYYLEDKKKGKSWITRLPFPVQCVSNVEVIDRITRNRLVTSYSYHHGYYDCVESEFRGFGRVEQTDTESFENFKKSESGNDPEQEKLFQKPVLTKTWFHTGAFLNRKKIFTQFEDEYYHPEDDSGVDEKILEDAPLEPGLITEEIREAFRACKGIPLRTEVYALDQDEYPDKAKHPYSTAQHTCIVKTLQPQGQNKNGVFFVHEKEVLTYYYERNPVDPRTSHSIILSIDEFGNVLESVSIAYGRTLNDPDLSEYEQNTQKKAFLIYTKNDYTNGIEDYNNHHLPVLCETLTYELTGWNSINNYFASEDFVNVLQEQEIKYEDTPEGPGKQIRLVERIRNYFQQSISQEPTRLDFKEIEIPVLPFEAYKLAFTDDLISYLYDGDTAGPLLTDEGKYISLDPGNYWIPSGKQTFDKGNFYNVIKVTDPFDNETIIEYDANYNFFVNKITDAIGNNTEVEKFQYRVLSPQLMIDMNGNRKGVRFDEIGMVVSAFVMGKDSEAVNSKKGDEMDLSATEISAYDKPSSMIEYDIDRWYVQTSDPGFDILNYKPIPNYVKLAAYENHYWDEGNIPEANRKKQISYTYSDGSGNEVQKKIQAEPGDAPMRNALGELLRNLDGTLQIGHSNPRWVGTGKVIFNNKLKPVKQYEPFFDSTFEYNDEKELFEYGVTPVVYYDPLDRVIRTDFPDGTFSKVEFDAWMQKIYDQVDTVLDSSWYIQRGSPSKDDREPADKDERAAWLAAIISETPATAHLDSLARSFLTIQHNRTFKIDNVSRLAVDVADFQYKTKIEFDIENNQRRITDARGNIVMEYRYDMLGNVCHQRSMDAGERWMLNEVTGKPLRSRDNREHRFKYEYDRLRRPISMIVNINNGPDKIYEKFEYGEIPNGEINNLRGKLHLHFDTAGKIQNHEYDFKGNLLSSTRELMVDYKGEVDWDYLEGLYNSKIQYDGLNRITKSITPDGSITTPIYNEANLLNELKVSVKGAAEKSFVENIDYNEKGQRTLIQYGNGTKTKYEYDKNTFRLKHLDTKLSSAGGTGGGFQNLNYTYDPVGNITQIEDRAQPTKFFNNFVSEPINKYTYDSIYQLTEATGREHPGQVDNGYKDNYNDASFMNSYDPGNDLLVRNYTQQYSYDVVGNIMQMKHITDGATGNWTRDYTYETNNNRLIKTKVGNGMNYEFNYTYNEHGSMTYMPHLNVIDWNFKEEMSHCDLGGGGNAYYVYDSDGQRVRKVIENGNLIKERIYFGNYEIYREKQGGVLNIERETLHIMDDKQRITMIDTRTHGNDSFEEQLTRYQYSNHLSTSTLELNNNAEVISYEEYHPYGTTSYQQVDKDINQVAKRYRYTGKERDEETGLNYHGARYYVMWLGRWASADPNYIKDGNNMYYYVTGNPIKLYDMNGREGISSEEDFISEQQYDASGKSIGIFEAYRRLTYDAQGNLINAEESIGSSTSVSTSTTQAQSPIGVIHNSDSGLLGKDENPSNSHSSLPRNNENSSDEDVFYHQGPKIKVKVGKLAEGDLRSGETKKKAKTDVKLDFYTLGLGQKTFRKEISDVFTTNLTFKSPEISLGAGLSWSEGKVKGSGSVGVTLASIKGGVETDIGKVSAGLEVGFKFSGETELGLGKIKINFKAVVLVGFDFGFEINPLEVAKSAIRIPTAFPAHTLVGGGYRRLLENPYTFIKK